MKKVFMVAYLFFCITEIARSDDTSVHLTLYSLYQASPSTPAEPTYGSRGTNLSGSSEKIFISDLPVENESRRFARISLDIGLNFIDIEFSHIGNAHITGDTDISGKYTAGTENTYVIRYDYVDTLADFKIIKAEIDESVTTLGLEPSDIRVEANQIYINLESLAFDTSSFARIKLEVEPAEFGSSEQSLVGRLSPNFDFIVPALNYHSREPEKGLQKVWGNFEYLGTNAEGRHIWGLRNHGFY